MTNVPWTDTMPIDDDGDDCGGNYLNGILGDRLTKQDCEAFYRHHARMARDRRKDKGAQLMAWGEIS